jgi:hypothetical protein
MVKVTFPDRATFKKALGFIVGNFSGRAYKSGVIVVPEAALEALAAQNIRFSVEGMTTYEEELTALRGPLSASIQRRQRRPAKLAK